MLRIQDLVFDAYGRRFFDEASATVPAGIKAGLVGRNGAGKSTLFRLIKGELSPGGGLDRMAARLAHGGGRSGTRRDAHSPARDGARRRRAARQADARGGDRAPEHLGEVYAKLSEIDADRAPARAAEILAGLGFSQARPLTAHGGVLRRMAHAGGHGRRPVR